MAKEKLPSESQVQKAVIAECRLRANNDPNYRLIVSYPGQRGNDYLWLQMKLEEGLAKGFPDLQILAPRRGFHGAFIELKVTTTPTPEQFQWRADLQSEGYFAEILKVKNSEAVMDCLAWYFGENDNEFWRAFAHWPN